jgi:serine/threonine protein kinase
MIGQELRGRYEILSRVGGGGMAIVYKAQDKLLNRNVAVKVLRQQFGQDEEFIRRFRREAQSAASLSHPNVVSIYDVGQEGDIHYIVMEYIEGHNLNEIIKERAPLQTEEAIHIASQICDALDHAHQNHIIHRDIKPHNILIGKNGRVKVTDFGIARAATSSDITQTGSVIGSVHYFSPEHAKGVSQGAKSDLYSLGIVLYQMLTNRLPFLGDSPISVALKHLQEHVEEPRKVNPLIPQSVENIILKAMRKNPEERYQSAKEMLADLETCLSPQRRNEEKLAFVDEDDDQEKTLVMPAIRSRHKGDGDSVQSNTETVVASKKRNHTKRLSWVKPVVWLIVLAVLLGGIWTGANTLLEKLNPPEVLVPSVIDKSFEEAKKELESLNLKVPEPEREHHEKEVGTVIDQYPKEMKVVEGSDIMLTVSKGPKTHIMEDYVDKNFEEMKVDLLRMGIGNDQIQPKEVFSDLPEGTVISHTPKAKDEFNVSTVTIEVEVSKGKGTITMPKLEGKNVSEAQATLTRYNLKLYEENGIEYIPNYEIKEGIVIGTHPYVEGNEVEPGTEIRLYVSSGPSPDWIHAKKEVTVSPVVEGEGSKIKIETFDMKNNGDKVVFLDETTITKTTTYHVDVVVGSGDNEHAIIKVYRNGYHVDTWTVTYLEAQQQASPTSTRSGGILDTITSAVTGGAD